MKWIAVAIALFIVAIAFDLGLLVYAIYALVGILAAARFVTRRWSQNLVATREVSATRADIGDVVDVVIEIENQDRWPITWMLADDLLPPQATGIKPALTVNGKRLAVLEFRGEQKHTLHYQLKCNRRGYFQIGPLVIETGDMFGFNRKFKVLTDPCFLMVYPKVIPLGGYDIASRRPIGEVIMTNRLFEDPTRIAGVRDYQAGDPFNRIHWKKSASTGQLQSKIYEPSSLAGATIVIDFHREALDPKHEPVRSELAVTAAASVASTLVEMGQQVGFVSNGRDAVDRITSEGWQGDERTRDAARSAAKMMKSKNDRLQPVIIPTQKSPDQAIRILRALARLEITEGLTLPELLTEAGSQLPRDATVIAIVSEMKMETAIALGNLKQQGYSVVAIVNTFSEDRFVQTTAPLLAEGISAMHLKDEESIRNICEKQALRS